MADDDDGAVPSMDGALHGLPDEPELSLPQVDWVAAGYLLLYAGCALLGAAVLLQAVARSRRRSSVRLTLGPPAPDPEPCVCPRAF